jgi:hypothetical protein
MRVRPCRRQTLCRAYATPPRGCGRFSALRGRRCRAPRGRRSTPPAAVMPEPEGGLARTDQ